MARWPAFIGSGRRPLVIIPVAVAGRRGA